MAPPFPEHPQSGSSSQAQQLQKTLPWRRWIAEGGVCLILFGTSLWIRSLLLDNQNPIAIALPIVFGAVALIFTFVQILFPKNTEVPSPPVQPTSLHDNSRLVKVIDLVIPVLGIFFVFLPWVISPSPPCSDNLITCRSHAVKVVPIEVPGESTSTATLDSSHSTIQFAFNNTKNGTGLAFQIVPPLGVTSFRFVEIKGKSTKQFSFEIQYKVKTSEGQKEVLKIVSTSNPQPFPASSGLQTVRAPIVYNGSVDEVVINCFERGQSSVVSISSINLKGEPGPPVSPETIAMFIGAFALIITVIIWYFVDFRRDRANRSVERT